MLSGTDEADLDARIAALDKARPRLSLGRASPQGVAIDAGGRKSFAELGLATDGFSGRHFQSSVDIALPADFYPSGYEKARLLIDGYHSGALDGRGELIVRVNDAIVSSISMASGVAEKFDRQPVELPLRFFHPGHNEISIEGITSSALDQQCDLVSMPRDARLTIAGTSELEFPSFAHLGTLPQIPSAIAAIAAPDKERPPDRLSGRSRSKLGRDRADDPGQLGFDVGQVRRSDRAPRAADAGRRSGNRRRVARPIARLPGHAVARDRRAGRSGGYSAAGTDPAAADGAKQGDARRRRAEVPRTAGRRGERRFQGPPARRFRLRRSPVEDGGFHLSRRRSSGGPADVACAFPVDRGRESEPHDQDDRRRRPFRSSPTTLRNGWWFRRKIPTA